MKKLQIVLFIIALVAMICLPPQTSVFACSGPSCRGIDPYESTDAYGAVCAASGYTVYSAMDRTSTGTNGKVETDLRYSYSPPDHGCYSNWTRGWVRENNANTKYLYSKVWEKSYPSWNCYYYIAGNPLAVGSHTWTDMVNGASGNIAIAFAGISSSSWSGPYSPSFQYEG